MSNNPKKKNEFDDKKDFSTYEFQSLLIGSDKKVLRFGMPFSPILKILEERNCKFTSIILQTNSAKENKTKEDLIFAYKEDQDINEIISEKKFDVILIDEFLERLKYPIEFLKKLPNFLNKNGILVISLPNIAHASIRLKLLNGNFFYEDTGALSKENLRFFTLDSIRTMLEDADFELKDLHRVKKSELFTDSKIKHYVIPDELIEAIMRDYESTTVQYVFSANIKSENIINSKKWSTNFSNDITTERLKEILHYYREYLKKYLENAIKDKDVVIKGYENSIKEYKDMVELLKHKIMQQEQIIKDYKENI